MESRGRRLVVVLVLAASYYGAAKLGLSAGALKGNVTPVWPPTGLGIAALLLFGPRVWPGVALGALLVNGLSDVPLASAVGMATGNTLESLLGALLIRRVAGGLPQFSRVREVTSLGVAALLATVVSAVFGVASLYLGDVIPGSAVAETWRVWWVGDALGALVVVPVLLTLVGRVQGTRAARPWEQAALVAGVVAVSWPAFWSPSAHPYLIFPVLLWAGLRLGPRTTSAITLIVSALAVTATAQHHGVFALGSATSSLWQLDTFLAVVAGTGLVLAAVVCERDLSAREVRSLTTALQARVQELQDANQELEAFTYSVSHDLRAPLRNINGFARNLGRLHGDSLDDEGRRFLDVIRRNATAMGVLIDELLAFSRLQRQPLRRQSVAMEGPVRQALAALEAELADRSVDIDIASLPMAEVDPGLMTQVWANLLGNALKFTRSREHARIEVGSRVEGGQVVFFVRDNGVGFDEEFADKLFGVFQRLHRLEDYEGSGVGLAIVQRIVSRHGGRVWAEGAVDHGATVSFTVAGGEA